MAKIKNTLFQKFKSESDRSSANNKLKSGNIYRIIVFLISTLICTTFFSLKFDQDELNLNFSIHEGGIWPEKTIKSDYSFPIKKDKKQYLKEVNETKQNALLVFKLNKNNQESFQKKLKLVLISKQIKEEFNPDLKLELKNYNDALNKLNTIINKLLTTAYKKGYIDIDLDDISQNEIIAQYDKTRTILPKSNIYDQTKLREKFLTHIKTDIPTVYRDEFEQIFEKINISNLIFDVELSELNKELLAKNVTKTEGIVRKGEIIVHKGEKINSDIIKKLSSYGLTKYMTTEKDTAIFKYFGSFGHVSLIFSFIIIFIYRIRKNIYYSKLKYTLVNLFLIIPTFIAWISLDINSPYPIEYLIFLPAISMLAAIIFDMRTAFFLTISIALLVAGVRNNDYMLAVIMLFAGFFSLYSVKEIQNRSQVYKSILYVFIGFTIPILIFGFERSFSIQLIFESITVASINAIVSPIITFGLLYIIEKITPITTDLGLLEYDNLNHPLLLKLNELAPGTYQHTLGVATLSERCANEIGANTLFCKVSTYYHDLGKMMRPEYFAENQMDMGNKHDKISPLNSATIIRDHVTKGIEIAKENNLPQAIIDIIPMHHGTSVIKHFYAKEIEAKGKDNVNIDDFSYPGPKPNSKEAAIIMICDSAEAVSRLEDQSKEELNKMIQDIIHNFTKQGQFDECNITLNQLATIKKVLIKTLHAKGHKRVKYKEIDENDITDKK